MSKECQIRSWGNGESKWLCVQLCPALCNPVEYSPPGSSCMGFLLEWVAIPFSKESNRSVPKSSREFAMILFPSCHHSVLRENQPSKSRFPWFMPGGLIVLHQGLTLQERRLEVDNSQERLSYFSNFFFKLVSVLCRVLFQTVMVFRIPLVS